MGDFWFGLFSGQESIYNVDLDKQNILAALWKQKV